ncbi:MAG: DUF1269 domain-containing protein [Ilumatobacteraceae bacterium]
MHSHRHDDVPQTLVGISFPDVFRAQEFLTASTRLASLGSLRIADAIILLKDEDGRTTVRETVDPQPAQTAISGAMWTGLLGLILAGPIGLLAGGALGAGTGAVAAKVIDLGIPDEWVDWFKQAVQPNTATVALLVTDLDEAALVREVARFTGQLVYANLSEETQHRLRTALGDVTPTEASGTTAGADADVEPTEGSNTLSP